VSLLPHAENLPKTTARKPTPTTKKKLASSG
jgi:hypothetical protein